MFKRRVGGVYFAIITQAVAAIADDPDRRPAGLYGRHQRHHRPAHAPRLGHPAGRRQGDPLLRQRRPAHRLHPAGAVRQALEARPHPGGDARQGGPGPVLRLQRRQLQDLRLLPGRRFRRDRRRHVHPAGRLHVAVLRRHRAVGRDGDLHRGRRAHLHLRRDLGHAARQLRQDELLRELPAALAVRPRRSLHRRGDAVPRRSRGPLEQLRAAHASTGLDCGP